jgi:Family of unknown function (DUF5999)
MCDHEPACPPAYAPDRDAARVLAAHPDQGWSLLCNGVLVFDDTGELLPDGRVIAPHRPAVHRGRTARRTLPHLVALRGVSTSPEVLL